MNIKIPQLVCTLSIVSYFLLLSSCSGENKPSNQELKNALAQNLPSYLTIDDLVIKASQNYGNDVDPRWGARFQATVKSEVDLYILDEVESGITFLQLKTAQGSMQQLYGKSTSTLYQELWRYVFEYDGKPIPKLGHPENSFSGKTIVRDSKEEESYNAEKTRVAEQHRKNIDNAEKLLVGSWRTKKSLFTYGADGLFTGKHNNGTEDMGEWRTHGDILYIVYKKYRKRSHDDWKTRSKQRVISFKIVQIESTIYTIEALNKANKTYTAKRIN